MYKQTLSLSRMEDERETASLRHRRRKSHLGLSSCFQSSHYDSCDSSSVSSPEANDRSSLGLRSPTSWFRSEGRGRNRNSFSRLGRHARRRSADFSYDPLSYARNFDDGSSDDSLLDQFSARLPVSPPRQRIAAGGSRFRDVGELPQLPLSAERKKVQSQEASADRESCVEDPPATMGGKAIVQRR